MAQEPRHAHTWEERRINSLELALEAVQALEDRLGRDIRVLDVRGVSTITDYCVVVSGTSSPIEFFMTYLSEHLAQFGLGRNVRPHRTILRSSRK